MHSGIESKAAFTLETGDYGTPIQIASGDQIHFDNESLRPTQQNVKDDYFSITNRGYSISDQVFKSVGGNISIEPYYDDINLIAAAMGLSNLDSSPQDLSGGAFQHNFYLDDDKADRAQDSRDRSVPDVAKPMKRRGTVAIEKGANVWQYPSAMINTMTINADAVGGVSMNFGILARDIGLNQLPNGSSAGWTFANSSNEDKVLFEDIKVYVSDFDEVDPLNDSHLVCLSSFSFTIDSHLSIQNDRDTNTLISQPFGRLGTITGSFNFPFFTNAQETTQIQNLLDAQKVRIIILFTSDKSISASAIKYAYEIDIKQAFLTTGGADVSGPGIIPTQLNFIADRTATGAPTNVPNDIEFVIKNSISTNPLEY
jgi:hypothetical protein